jgi:hypothetical protein
MQLVAQQPEEASFSGQTDNVGGQSVALQAVYIYNIGNISVCCHQTPLRLCRVDAPIYFANVEWVRGRVDKYRKRADNHKEGGPVYFVILDMSPVPFVDSTGANLRA